MHNKAMALNINYNELAIELKDNLDDDEWLSCVLLPVFEYNGKKVRCELTIKGDSESDDNDEGCPENTFYTSIALVIYEEIFDDDDEDEDYVVEHKELQLFVKTITHTEEDCSTVAKIEDMIKNLVRQMTFRNELLNKKN